MVIGIAAAVAWLMLSTTLPVIIAAAIATGEVWTGEAVDSESGRSRQDRCPGANNASMSACVNATKAKPRRSVCTMGSRRDGTRSTESNTTQTIQLPAMAGT